MQFNFVTFRHIRCNPPHSLGQEQDKVRHIRKKYQLQILAKNLHNFHPLYFSNGGMHMLKKKQSLTLFCAIFTLFTSCDEIHTRDDPYRLRDIEDEICTPLERQGLKRCYTGPRGYLNREDKFWLTFKTNEFHFENVDAARLFFVKKIEYLLQSFNKAPKLKPFLIEPIVKVNELWIKIDMYRKPELLPEPPELFRLEIKDSQVSYYTWDREKKAATLVLKEPYETALKKAGKKLP